MSTSFKLGHQWALNALSFTRRHAAAVAIAGVALATTAAAATTFYFSQPGAPVKANIVTQDPELKGSWLAVAAYTRSSPSSQPNQHENLVHVAIAGQEVTILGSALPIKPPYWPLHWSNGQADVFQERPKEPGQIRQRQTGQDLPRGAS